MSEDDSFEPRLGRIRSKGGRTAKRFLHQVLAATALAGGLKRLGGARFTGARIGRGRVLGECWAAGTGWRACAGGAGL